MFGFKIRFPRKQNLPLDPVLIDLKVPEIVQRYTASVHTEILPSDGMFQNDRYHYFSCGASALGCILHAIGISGIAKPNRILDFGCGAGRVTRWLRVAFPDAHIEACDIREGDLAFVKRYFSAKTWISGIDVANLNPPGSYDVIWVGSVFTHLSAETSTNLFNKLTEWLNPDGVLILSFHGRYVLHRDFVDNGYGYADYPKEFGLGPGYGISLSKSAWWISLLESRTNIRLVCLTERVWDRHHDVIAVQKSNWD